MKNKHFVIGAVVIGLALVLVTVGITLWVTRDRPSLHEDFFDRLETNITGHISESGFIAGWDYENNGPLAEITTATLEEGFIMSYMRVSGVEDVALIGVYRMFPDGTVENEMIEVFEDSYVTVTTPTDKGAGTYVVILALGEQLVVDEIEVIH